MGKIFNRDKKPKVEMANAPVSPETPGEIKEIERLNNPQNAQPVEQPVVPVAQPTQEYREIPVCMSQEQINNLVIENNLMLKQIISNMDD